MKKITSRKRILTICLVLALSIMCWGAAFAAPSVQIGNTEVTGEVVMTIDGEKVTLTKTDANTWSSADGKYQIKLTNTDGSSEQQQQALDAAANDPDLQNATFAALFDLSFYIDGEKADYSGAAFEFTLKIDGLGPNDKVFALHGSDADGFDNAEKIVGTNNGDGTATFSVTSMSPFAVFTVKADDSEGTSPQTGMDNIALMVALIAIGAAAVIYGKKQLN